MSGQYPPPNPPHPFGRQRGPSLPPWGRTTQTPGVNPMGSGMNFYGPPHMGMPGRESWTHPKAVDTMPRVASPLYGLQTMRASESGQRRPSETQQEETMDLSSHASVPVPATGDTLRNGAVPVQPAEVNGEVSRIPVAEPHVKDSAVTSVIAPNPLRETTTSTDTLGCSKVVENAVNKLESTLIPENVSASLESFENIEFSTCAKSENSVSDSSLPVSVYGLDSSVLKTTSSNSGSSMFSNSIQLGERSSCSDHSPQQFHSFVSDVEKPSEEINSNQNAIDSLRHTTNDFKNSSVPMEPHSLIEEHSFMNNSALSLDAEESKLVVAESSSDIFNTSPDSSACNSQEEKSTVGSSMPSSIPSSVPVKTLDPPFILPAPNEKLKTLETSEPNPSVENVEILLESMFSGTSCSPQLSNSINPPSVIVSSGAKMSLETPQPPPDVSPLKAEELAQTLAEDSPIEDTVMDLKEEKENDEVQDDYMDEIEKNLQMLTESGTIKQPSLDVDVPALKSIEKDQVPIKAINKVKTEDALLLNNNSDTQQPSFSSFPKTESIESLPTTAELSTSQSQDEPSITETQVITDVVPKTEPKNASNTNSGTPNNSFIEVESELEKMFAGIVEPAEGIESKGTSQPSTSEAKKSATNKRPAAKRKKANSRRVSDISLFDGSSGETTPVKKRGRKRINDSGSEKASKKIKSDNSDSFKKGRVPKDVLSEKAKGPFVHIEGSKESPASVVVVNSGVRVDDDDGADKASGRKKHSAAQRSEGGVHRRVAGAYSSSAMSARYNSDKADLTWVCVFCKRGPHCAGGLGGEPAGDLFGPYRVPATPPHDDLPPPGTVPDRDLVEEQKRRGGKYPASIRASGGADAFIHKTVKKNKRSQSTDSLDQAGLLAVEGGYEVWLHAQCAEWAPGLCIIGTQVVGLEDAVWAALRTRCTHCGESGAGIGCVVRSCPTRMHFPCAVVSGWLLDPETFIARCHVHRTRLRPS